MVDFSFPLPEKKAGKEKKSKKVSSDGKLVADGSAEVQKKKKVHARPWDGGTMGELL